MNISRYKSALPFRNYWLLIVLGVVAVTGVVVFGRGEKPAVAEDTTRIVRSFTVGSAYTTAPRYTGTVHAHTESDLGFRVSGKIIEKLIDQGDKVKRDQPLMRLDPVDLELASRAAEQAVVAARAEYERAVPDAKRYQQLLEALAVSKQEYERALAAANASAARLKGAEADARRAGNELDYAVLRADADGVIMEVRGDAGQVVSAGHVVLRLARDGAREAVVNLPENAFGKARSATYAYLYTQPQRRFPVTLRELSAMADPVSRTYQARYTLLDGGKDAPLGATVTVVHEADTTGNQDGYEVPIGSLYDTGSGTSVWVINDANSTVALRRITVTHVGQETAGIVGDIRSGERIVAFGAHLLKPADKVRVASVNESNNTP